MDYVTRQFINLTKKLRKDLRAALTRFNEVTQKQTEAIKEATDARKESQYSPSVLRAEFYVPPSERYQKETDRTRHLIIEYWKLWVEIIGIIVVIAYTTVAAFQLREMIRQYPEIKKSADAARDTAQATKDSLEKVQRAFVYLPTTVDPIINQTGKIPEASFNFQWENSGTTPTESFTTHISYKWFEKGLPKNYSFPDFWEPNFPHINTKFFIGPKSHSGVVVGPISSVITDQVFAHQIHLYFWGWAKYRDIFPDTPQHVSIFCYEFVPISKDRFTFLMNACPVHNCTDEECSK